MQKVFVIDKNKKPLMPCSEKRARVLLRQKKAAIFLHYPFVIILKAEGTYETPRLLQLKIDPGSKVTGFAILDVKYSEVVWAAELKHRGSKIVIELKKRASIRGSRRSRKTGYRKQKYIKIRESNNKKQVRLAAGEKRLNQDTANKAGWIAPSIMHRVETTYTWVKRLIKYAPIGAISIENCKFDMQKMENPEISGIEYQRGTLFGYEIKYYLLEKWRYQCAYCGKKDVPLMPAEFEKEHVVARSKGGSSRISNLVISCVACNKSKGNKSVAEFLKDKPDKLKDILKQLQPSLKDAAVLNTSRKIILQRLQDFDLPIETGSGGLTAFNRSQQDLPKEHWIDAACVGVSTPKNLKIAGIRPLKIKASGHGNRQLVRTDKYGFTKNNKPKSGKEFFGFKSGDIVKAIVLVGKQKGVHVGRLNVSASGFFGITNNNKKVAGVKYIYCKKLQMNDGYCY